MISPHPDTAQLVATAARKERLASLAVSQRRPGLLAVGWPAVVRFVAYAGFLGGRLLARTRQRASSHPTPRQAARGPAHPQPSVPEFRRYRGAVNKPTRHVTEASRALGKMSSDR